MSLLQAALEQALHQIRTNVTSFSDALRSRLRNIALEIASALESPHETHRALWCAPWHPTALKVAADAGWLQLLASSDRPLTVEEIAAKTKGTPTVVLQFVRVLTGLGYVGQNDSGAFVANEKTRTLASELGVSLIALTTDNFVRTAQATPTWLARKDYQPPRGVSDTAMPLWTGGKTMWEWMEEHSDSRAVFSKVMAAEQSVRPDWTLIYPCKERMMRSSPSPEVLLVDIGGNTGLHLRMFRDRRFGLPGELVLQDLPGNVEAVDATLNAGIEAMAYDFFTPQPVKGAGNYYMSRILHDWSDEEATTILKNQAGAMATGSRLLINDFVLPEAKTALFPACLSALMMCNVGGMERTRSQWERLLAGAGMRIMDIISMSEDGDSIIECALV
ncbi:hypothetical protein BAUCODRAFT_242672 [Baudoinia panamericana UAMH 10762]|uniref:O-methyltransferase C-terminal domain-containing protein n=1 Tax=Baudoinia panamericana (strain UAMH 10762) TaxID=717646 RepID=M2N446_BAUPA|nr:uncharacterized protein BAUCODRAFT_242672 [Baudoinia panamericana UAMH 10762]EMC93470.1 hypothetical protein BAUCODRAFT_242672 [Baudoinia panamericana UAMH 10762]